MDAKQVAMKWLLEKCLDDCSLGGILQALAAVCQDRADAETDCEMSELWQDESNKLESAASDSQL